MKTKEELKEVKEKLVVSRKSYMFINSTDSIPIEIDNSEEIDILQIGQTVTHWVGAPGCGRLVYKITRIDEKGAWGICIEDTTDTGEDI